MKEAGLCPVEEEEVGAVSPQKTHIIKLIWMTLLMTLHYLLHDGQDHLSQLMLDHPTQMVEKIREVEQLSHL